MSINNKNTDNSVSEPLKMIKAIAKEYLARPIIPKSGFEELLVDHPFFSTIFFSDGKTTFFLNDKEDEADARKYFEETIDRATGLYGITMMITKPYKLSFLRDIKPYLTKEEFAEEFKMAWIETEFPNRDPEISIDQFVAMWKSVGNDAMSDSERKLLASLPQTVHIYRGISRGGSPRGISWTTSRSIAEWFANRFADDDCQVYEADVDVKDVIAYLAERSEKEVIVDPSTLKNVSVSTL